MWCPDIQKKDDYDQQPGFYFPDLCDRDAGSNLHVVVIKWISLPICLLLCALAILIGI